MSVIKPRFTSGTLLLTAAMDFDRCLTANSRYFDAWCSFPTPNGLPTYPTLRDQHDYPSPAPSCSDPSPVSRTLDPFATSNDFTVASFNQIDSSIGPIRASRRHSSLRESAHTRRWSSSSSGVKEQDFSVRSFVYPPCSITQLTGV